MLVIAMLIVVTLVNARLGSGEAASGGDAEDEVAVPVVVH
jgi:hypothetical protein